MVALDAMCARSGKRGTAYRLGKLLELFSSSKIRTFYVEKRANKYRKGVRRNLFVAMRESAILSAAGADNRSVLASKGSVMSRNQVE